MLRCLVITIGPIFWMKDLHMEKIYIYSRIHYRCDLILNFFIIFYLTRESMSREAVLMRELMYLHCLHLKHQQLKAMVTKRRRKRRRKNQRPVQKNKQLYVLINNPSFTLHVHPGLPLVEVWESFTPNFSFDFQNFKLFLL